MLSINGVQLSYDRLGIRGGVVCSLVSLGLLRYTRQAAY